MVKNCAGSSVEMLAYLILIQIFKVFAKHLTETSAGDGLVFAEFVILFSQFIIAEDLIRFSDLKRAVY
jgi:hypothetical protein